MSFAPSRSPATDFLAAVESASGDVAGAALNRANDLRSKHAVAMEKFVPPPPETVLELAAQLALLPGCFKEARSSLALSIASLEAKEKDARLALLAVESARFEPVRFDKRAGAGAFVPEGVAHDKPSPSIFFTDSRLELSRRLAQSSTFAQAVDALFDHLSQAVLSFQKLFPTEPQSRAVSWCIACVNDFCEQDFLPLAIPEAPGCRGNELTETEWQALAEALSQALAAADKSASHGLALSFVLMRAIRPTLVSMINDDVESVMSTPVKKLIA